MHSSRMRTGRSLTVCCSLLPGGSAWSRGVLPDGGGCLPGAGGYLPGPGGGSPCPGSAWSRGGSAWSGEVSLPGSVCLVPGGLPGLRGGSPCLGGLPGEPPVNRITDTCKNITLATTSLWPVKTLTKQATRTASLL